MSRDFGDDGSHDYFTAGGSLGSVTEFSIIGLMKPTSSSRGAVATMRDGDGSNLAQIIMDSGFWFGGGDFSGFNTAPPTANTWQIIGVTKAAGSSVYRWHWWNYDTPGAKTHANGSGAHADPGAIAALRLGDGDNESHGLIAVVGVWTRAISDGEFDALCTAALADWAALSPDRLYADDFATDLAGGSGSTTVTGTVNAGADPAGYSYSLTPPTNDAELAATLPALTAALASDTLNDAVMAGALPSLTGVFTADSVNDGVLAGTLPQLTSAFTGDAITDGVLAGSLPALTAALTADARNDGVLAGTFPLLTCSLTDVVANPPGHVSLSSAAVAMAVSATRTAMTVEAA